MKVIVIGATGATGKEVINLLLKNKTYSKVVVLARRSINIEHPKLETIIVDFNHLEKWASYINGDVAISCLGTTLKIAGSKEAQYTVDYTYQYNFSKIASSNNIKTFLLVSSMSAHPKAMFFYARMKGELEEAIKKLPFTNTIFFRPGPLIRPSSNRNGENFSVKLFSFLNKFNIANSFKPIKVKDLAKVMVKSTNEPENGLTILESKEIIKLISK